MMDQARFTPRDLLAGQRIAQALAVGLEMDRALLANAAQLFDDAARSPHEAYKLNRQIADTLRVILSMLPD